MAHPDQCEWLGRKKRMNFTTTCTINKQATNMAYFDQGEWLGRKKR
jgi:hypothetical protein